tara:strand:+ start:384 stop:746 length:363 start_codon:yes stop_codon:yes gene_type:complete
MFTRDIGRWIIGFLIVVFLITFIANNVKSGSGICRPVASLVAFIEDVEDEPVTFDFLSAEERARFAAGTNLENHETAEILIGVKEADDPIIVAIIREGCVTSVRFFSATILGIIREGTKI